MLKNLIIRIILVFIIISSVLAVYRQVKIIRSANVSIVELETKILRLESRNNALRDALK